ncbi:MAG: hypothetical protein AAF938_00890 [Myxococcota bacterium]
MGFDSFERALPEPDAGEPTLLDGGGVERGEADLGFSLADAGPDALPEPDAALNSDIGAPDGGSGPASTALLLEGTGTVGLRALAVGDDGGLVIAGTLEDEGLGLLSGPDYAAIGMGTHAFVLRLWPDGTQRWLHVWGFGARTNVVEDVAVMNDVVYATGTCAGDFVLDGVGYDLGGRQEAPLIAFGPDGDVEAIRLYEGSRNVQGRTISAEDGLLLFGGSYDGTLDLGLGPLEPRMGDGFTWGFGAVLRHVGDEFVAQRQLRVTSRSTAVVFGMALVDGEIYAGGRIDRGAFDDGPPLPSLGQQDAFLVRINDGPPDALLNFGTSRNDFIWDLVSDGDAVWSIGMVAGPTPVGGALGSSLATHGANDGFLVRHDITSATGDAQYALAIGGTGNDRTWALDVDSAGRALVGGDARGDFMFGAEAFSFEDPTAYVMRFDPDGGTQRYAFAGGTGTSVTYAVAHHSGDVYVAGGALEGNVELGDTSLTAARSSAFVWTFRFSRGGG